MIETGYLQREEWSKQKRRHERAYQRYCQGQITRKKNLMALFCLASVGIAFGSLCMPPKSGKEISLGLATGLITVAVGCAGQRHFWEREFKASQKRVARIRD